MHVAASEASSQLAIAIHAVIAFSRSGNAVPVQITMLKARVWSCQTMLGTTGKNRS